MSHKDGPQPPQVRRRRDLRSSRVTDAGRTDQRRTKPCRAAAAPTKVRTGRGRRSTGAEHRRATNSYQRRGAAVGFGPAAPKKVAIPCCSDKSGLPGRGVRRMSVVIGEAVGPHASVGLPPSSMLRPPACTPFQEEDACNIRESVDIARAAADAAWCDPQA